MKPTCAVALLAAVAWLPVWADECPPDVVWAEVEGDQVTVHHESAEFNCCPVLEYEVVQNGYEVDIYELEVEAQCLCVCCFDLMHALVDLAPGTYTVRVWVPTAATPSPAARSSSRSAMARAAPRCSASPVAAAAGPASSSCSPTASSAATCRGGTESFRAIPLRSGPSRRRRASAGGQRCSLATGSGAGRELPSQQDGQRR